MGASAETSHNRGTDGQRRPCQPVPDQPSPHSQCGEPGWELPLWAGYRKAIESDVADVKNFQLGAVADFGAILGGLYLREFVSDIPWAHMDIGSTALRHSADEMWAAGATGQPTRTLIRYLTDQESSAATNEYVSS